MGLYVTSPELSSARGIIICFIRQNYPAHMVLKGIIHEFLHYSVCMVNRQKRSTFAPVTFESDGAAVKKVAKNDQKIYSPPSGKFSEKAGTYQGYYICSSVLLGVQ